MQVVWVDEMAMELKLPTSRNVLCRKGEEVYPAEDARLNKARRHPKIIHALYAVNPLVGPVHIQVLSGTTDQDLGYMV